MAVYTIEPKKGFTHVLRAYSDADNMVEVELRDGVKPFDYSSCTDISILVGETQIAAFDKTNAGNGILGFSLSGIEPGGYLVSITVTIDGRKLSFGTVRVFVETVKSCKDIPVYNDDPDVPKELVTNDNVNTSTETLHYVLCTVQSK